MDVSVKEAFLHIAVSHPRDQTIFLQRDGLTFMVLPAVADTNIVDPTLSENRAYVYRAILRTGGFTISTSNEVGVHTLLSTSHDFSFQTFVLGVGNASELYDVTIVNDSLAYAVGDMYLNDSTGRLDTDLYNFAVWDGHTWSVRRLYYDYHGQPELSALQTIFSVNDHNLWVAGNGVQHWNGVSFQSMELPASVWGPYLTNKVWASEDEAYVGGDGGSIAFYNGASWGRIEGGTTTRIRDVWGIANRTTNVAYVLADFPDEQTGRRIIRISENHQVDTIPWGFESHFYSLWTRNAISLYVCGQGLFRNSGQGWRRIDIGADINMNCIRGNAENDIILVGGLGLIAHFNGLAWQRMSVSANAHLLSVAISGNTVVAVGTYGSRAVAVVGRRAG